LQGGLLLTQVRRAPLNYSPRRRRTRPYPRSTAPKPPSSLTTRAPDWRRQAPAQRATHNVCFARGCESRPLPELVDARNESQNHADVVEVLLLGQQRSHPRGHELTAAKGVLRQSGPRRRNVAGLGCSSRQTGRSLPPRHRLPACDRFGDQTRAGPGRPLAHSGASTPSPRSCGWSPKRSLRDQPDRRKHSSVRQWTLSLLRLRFRRSMLRCPRITPLSSAVTPRARMSFELPGIDRELGELGEAWAECVQGPACPIGRVGGDAEPAERDREPSHPDVG
jgi:hypothetical protein